MWPGLRPRREVAPLKGLGFFYGAFPALTRWANEFRRCAAGAEVTSGGIRLVAFFRGLQSFWILIRSLLYCSMVTLLVASAGLGTASCIPPSHHVPPDFFRMRGFGSAIQTGTGGALFHCDSAACGMKLI